MKECREVFRKDEFLLDEDPYKICMETKKLDLRKGELSPSLPEDNLSMSVGYEYVEYDEYDEDVIKLDEFLSQVFPDPELKQYFLEYTASLLVGGNHSKKVHFFTGPTHAGKSVTISLLEKMLGKLSVKMPTTAITGKRQQSSGCTPEMIRAKGVHLIIFQETAGEEHINIGIYKELSGNDSIYARGLWSDGTQFVPMFKPVIVCNDLPPLDTDDEAAQERAMVLPFESKFVITGYPETYEEQMQKKIFPRNPEFDKHIDKLKYPLMWRAFNIFKQTGGRITKIPDKVNLATIRYITNNDFISRFEKERIIEDKDGTISDIDLHFEFSEWYKDEYGGKPIARNEFVDKILKKWGPFSKGRKWCHKRIKTVEDEEKEGTVLIIRQEDLKSNNLMS